MPEMIESAMAHRTEPMLPEVLRIDKFKMENADTFTIELQAGGGRPFHFKPGQFNMLYAYGVGEVPISISGDPADSSRLVHTTRAVGTVTRVLGALREGHLLGVRGPYGSAWPVDEARGKDIVLVAGGIGLAPLRPVIYHIMANREQYGKFLILYGARTPDDLLYKKELHRWSARFDTEVFITVDHSVGRWHGNVGVVTNLITRAPLDRRNTIAMVCGPEIMMRFCVAELHNRGVPQHCVYVSMERNMKCAIGFCGHCQYGGHFVCKDGPVFRYDRIHHLFVNYEI